MDMQLYLKHGVSSSDIVRDRHIIRKRRRGGVKGINGSECVEPDIVSSNGWGTSQSEVQRSKLSTLELYNSQGYSQNWLQFEKNCLDCVKFDVEWEFWGESSG